VVQFLVSPLLLWKSFLSATISCALYAVALSYYHYLNFLGYSALPFLERTEVSVSSSADEWVLAYARCFQLIQLQLHQGTVGWQSSACIFDVPGSTPLYVG
jgi:hypothetical protein